MNKQSLLLRNKLLIVCGPTATGKTALGIQLAKRFSGEIVSADSRQVYIGMDIGTGKDLSVNAKLKMQNEKLQIKIKNGQILKPYRFEGIPVWILDVARPNQEFSVAQYLELASKVIDDIQKKGKLPIVVGGTGLYIKGLLGEVETLGVPPDWTLRRKLERLPIGGLFEMLSQLDSSRAASMNVSDRQNPRRLIRAIEIALKMKNPSQKLVRLWRKKLKRNVLWLGLTAPYSTLYERVDCRVEERINMGAEQEVENLLAQGYSWDLPALSAMGYRQWRPYFEKKADIEDVIQRWKFDEHAYVRRQMTWFRKHKEIVWFDISQKDWMPEVEKIVETWYTGNKNVEKN